MRPRRLELSGFTAFRDRQEIDLSAFDLFVITGPTGAGKTSLLDALALALYGQVPRMGKHGLGQLVSHGKADARVLLEFEVEKRLYRVSRRLPRSGSQQGTFERWDGEAWVSEVGQAGIKPVNEAILRLVKLDFESFCKAIVLPQGEFARFLKGEPGDRRKTLTALLGLGAYERMAGLARERGKELRIKGDQTRAILGEQYADATAEALDHARGELETAARTAAAASEALSAARDADGRRGEAVARGEAAANLAQRFGELERELAGRVETCRLAETADREAQARCEAWRRSLDAAIQERADAVERRAQVEERTGSREQLALLASALEQRPLLDGRVQAAEERLDQATRALAEQERRRADCAAAEAQAKADLERTRAAEEETKARAAEHMERSDDLQQRLASASEARDERVRATTLRTELEERADAAGMAATSARSAQADAEAARDRLRHEHLVGTLAAGVQVGDPCPVCGRALAAHPAVDPDTERRLVDADETVRSAAGRSDETRSAAAAADERVKAARERVEAVDQRIVAALDGIPDVSGLQTMASRASADASAAQELLADAQKGRAAAEERAQKLVPEVARADAETRAAERERRQRVEDRDRVAADRERDLEALRGYFGEVISAHAAERIATARRDIHEADERAEEAARAEASAREALDAETRVHAEARGKLNGIDLELGRLRTRAEDAAEAAAGISSAPDLGHLPEPSRARDETATRLGSWCSTGRADLETAASASQEEATLAERDLVTLATARGVPVDDATAALPALEAARTDAIAAGARAEQDLENLRKRVDQRAHLEAEVATDAERIAVLDVLATELRADHFVDFVVQETLDVLAVHASNELLRISDDRYSLVSEEGEFSVVDHVNADERRSVRTLSGGETFMASLSLALALSRHVSDLAGEGLGTRLEAVFIDEGFGSLDPETLDEVIDALERLREDDLLIGVISHVPALAERIGVGLRVQRDGNRSVVTEAA